MGMSYRRAVHLVTANEAKIELFLFFNWCDIDKSPSVKKNLIVQNYSCEKDLFNSYQVEKQIQCMLCLPVLLPVHIYGCDLTYSGGRKWGSMGALPSHCFGEMLYYWLDDTILFLTKLKYLYIGGWCQEFNPLTFLPSFSTRFRYELTIICDILI